jgi:hypothetical protein
MRIFVMGCSSRGRDQGLVDAKATLCHRRMVGTMMLARIAGDPELSDESFTSTRAALRG